MVKTPSKPTSVSKPDEAKKGRPAVTPEEVAGIWEMVADSSSGKSHMVESQEVEPPTESHVTSAMLKELSAVLTATLFKCHDKTQKDPNGMEGKLQGFLDQQL